MYFFAALYLVNSAAKIFANSGTPLTFVVKLVVLTAYAFALASLYASVRSLFRSIVKRPETILDSNGVRQIGNFATNSFSWSELDKISVSQLPSRYGQGTLAIVLTGRSKAKPLFPQFYVIRIKPEYAEVKVRDVVHFLKTKRPDLCESLEADSAWLYAYPDTRTKA